MEIKWLSTSQSPGQIYSSGLEYCFINDNNEQCCSFVFCKDFLQDVVQGFLWDRVASIYGFSYDPQTMPSITLERTRIGLCNQKDKDFLSKKDQVLDFINQVEKELKLKPSKITVCTNPNKKSNGVLVLDGSTRWQESPPMLSLYTLLVRIGFVHKKGENYKNTINNLINGNTKPYQTNDKGYMTSSKVGLENIIQKGYRWYFYKDIKKNYPKKIDTSTMHNNLGIVNFSNEGAKSAMPSWYKQKTPKKKKVLSEKKEVSNILSKNAIDILMENVEDSLNLQPIIVSHF